MAADQLLQSIAHSTPGEEWFDFDNSFDIPYEGVGSNPTSVDSVSPKDLDLTFADFDDCNWGSSPGVCTQELFADLVNYDAPIEGFGGHALDTSQSMLNPTGSFHPMPTAPTQGLMGSGVDDLLSPDMGGVDDPFYTTFRQMVELQAAADPSSLSSKEKRMEASIALHMQRLQEAAMQDLELSSDSSTTFPSPRWSDSAASVYQGGTCATPATTPLPDVTRTPVSGSESAAGGMELVLDLNMNTTTNVPKKQKPRSQAQKENYIKVRKHGACEKHRKQHKRCNCLEKAASKIAVGQKAVSSCNIPMKSTFTTQRHVHRSERESLLLSTTPIPASKSTVSQPTGGLGSKELQYVQLRHRHRLPSTQTSMDPQYGHHSPQPVKSAASCRGDVGCNGGSGRPMALRESSGQQQSPRSPGSDRKVGLVHSPSKGLQIYSTTSQADRGALLAPRQSPGRQQSSRAVTAPMHVSVQASIPSRSSTSANTGVLCRSSVSGRASATTDVQSNRSSACSAIFERPASFWRIRSSKDPSTRHSLDVQANDVHDQFGSRTIVSRVLQSVFSVSHFLDLSVCFVSWLSTAFDKSGGFSRFSKFVMISTRRHWLAGKGFLWG
ncbi:hypothetical protein ASPBRDRAFT_42319 [Aspergillus brasiliensis CBS 101740]|uniref:Uncharacterized protein n=1 Tax=Aspergillus brasiliensis (strain CBS 101740 / IMI 381727 / IBT 21946) TaxID=767769 RepID=A0A1L9ULV6_ASPBC|nr:hypothetical protein ASPBRDRAFT_42319 [Aspergillus brasiliensis CBS 101740]